MPFIFALLGKGLASFGAKLLIALFTERMIKHVFFTLAKYIAKRTQTTKDDEFLDKLEDTYDHPDSGGNP
ncbi:hypothetical protein Erwinia_phage_Rouille_00052 [Erwinia phage Rouille]|uniref:Uncharacterized protein n=1 Tax=Salmonella phage SE5 TaxID=2575329 RepID=A0A5B9N1W2_9CAUD|nr:hypothetical protein [Salmonella phage SE5]UNA01016.1 hypothetical protein 1Hena2_00066 [Erwinia phage Hena2]WJN64808.1 hypothetical protein Erwinia_phage_Rouille_00052 [Erwinia phage Rouille]WLW39297.1 hypothetical protein [Erwinia phage vB_EamM-BoyaciRG1]WNA13693.1 hypothetical protein FIfi106_00046 [Erwinia phage FIfi106]CCA66292.1 hypothetical protein P11600420 [Erwinia phage phiEa116]